MHDSMESVERRCGIKGCVEDAVPGAFIEVLAGLGASFVTVRVEVCEEHMRQCGGEDLRGLSVA